MDPNTQLVLMALIGVVSTAITTIVGAYVSVKVATIQSKKLEDKVTQEVGVVNTTMKDVDKKIEVLKTQTDGIQHELSTALKGQAFGEGKDAGRLEEQDRSDKLAADANVNVLTKAATNMPVVDVKTRTEAKTEAKTEEIK